MSQQNAKEFVGVKERQHLVKHWSCPANTGRIHGQMRASASSTWKGWQKKTTLRPSVVQSTPIATTCDASSRDSLPMLLVARLHVSNPEQAPACAPDLFLTSVHKPFPNPFQLGEFPSLFLTSSEHIYMHLYPANGNH